MRASLGRSALVRGVALACSGAIVLGFLMRDESDLVARAGAGYGLGILGLAQMVLLLAYSLRKRLRPLRGAGALSRWFEIHMVLGLLGPTAVLFHCNFQLGSLNSAVALFSTLFVASSGLVGRFLYARIHHGLLGQRRSLAELQARLRDDKGALWRSVALVPGLREELDRFEGYALAPTGSALGSTLRFFALAPRTRRLRWRVRRKLKRGHRALGSDEGGTLRRELDAYLDSVFRAAILGSYEWLFGLWHAVHLPMCVVLFGSAAVHVWAVHVY